MTVEGVSAAKAVAPVESKREDPKTQEKQEAAKRSEDAAVVQLSSRPAEEAQ